MRGTRVGAHSNKWAYSSEGEITRKWQEGQNELTHVHIKVEMRAEDNEGD